MIYRELAKSELNEFHANPIFTSGSPSPGCGLNARGHQEDDHMRGEVLCFSDVSAVLGMVQSSAKPTTLQDHDLHALGAAPQCEVGGDFTGLCATGPASTATRTSSLPFFPPRDRGHDRLDCIHLLPCCAAIPLPPPAELAIMGRMPDCHWTSLNFFNYNPRDYYLTRGSPAARAGEHDSVDAPYAFGDVLMFMTAEGNALHSCVYIADDIIYTKNGENMASPGC